MKEKKRINMLRTRSPRRDVLYSQHPFAMFLELIYPLKMRKVVLSQSTNWYGGVPGLGPRKERERGNSRVATDGEEEEEEEVKEEEVKEEGGTGEEHWGNKRGVVDDLEESVDNERGGVPGLFLGVGYFMRLGQWICERG
eukprot:767620-Hanusia_phi.AAC.4